MGVTRWTFFLRAPGTLRSERVYVPDQVARDSAAHAGLSFLVLTRSGRKTRAVLAPSALNVHGEFWCLSYAAHRRAIGVDTWRRPSRAASLSRASVPTGPGALALPSGFFNPAP